MERPILSLSGGQRQKFFEEENRVAPESSAEAPVEEETQSKTVSPAPLISHVSRFELETKDNPFADLEQPELTTEVSLKRQVVLRQSSSGQANEAANNKDTAHKNTEVQEGLFAKTKPKAISENYPSQKHLEFAKTLGYQDELKRAEDNKILKKRKEAYEHKQTGLASGNKDAARVEERGLPQQKERGHARSVAERARDAQLVQQQRTKKLQEELDERNMLARLAQRGREFLAKMFRRREDEKARIEREHKEQRLKLERDLRQAQQRSVQTYREERNKLTKAQGLVRRDQQDQQRRTVLEALAKRLKLDKLFKDQQAWLQKRYRDLRAQLDRQLRERQRHLGQGASALSERQRIERQRVERVRGDRLQQNRIRRDRENVARRERTRRESSRRARQHRERQHHFEEERKREAERHQENHRREQERRRDDRRRGW